MKKILVIEDEAEIREKIVIILRQEGYDVLPAENGEKGVLAAFRYQPDLVVCDIMMPRLDGFEVFSEINLIPNQSMTPFVFLSAKTEKADIRKAMLLGAADYITKPFEINDLLASIKIQLSKKEEIEKRFQDEKIRLLGKLEEELIAKDLEIERLQKNNQFPEKNIESEKVTRIQKPEKKPDRPNTNVLLIAETSLAQLRLKTAISNNFPSNILEAETLKEAVTFADTIHIDYIIIQISTPYIDPMTIVRQIKCKPNLMYCPILISTDNINKNSISEFAKFNNVDFILNPFNPEKLCNKISKYIEAIK
jgi:DNA-binding response OmpR family regulator